MSDKPQTLADAIGVCLALGQRCLAEVRALARMPGPPGPQGPPGPAGRNAADVDLFKDYIDQSVAAMFKAAKFTTPDFFRTVHMTLGGVTHEFKTGTPLYRGVWKEGAYEFGDGVTLGGSYFIALSDTTAKPGTSDDWRLTVKRGADGRDLRPDEKRVAEPVKFR